MDLGQPHASENLLRDNDFAVKHSRGDQSKVETYETRSSNSSLFKTERPSLISPALKAWSFDLASCALAVVALAAIIITLAVHKGNTLPSWPLGITVNALISVFAVLFKVTLLIPVAGALSQLKWSWFGRERPLIDLVIFDNASRGNIWSAGKLIARTKGIQIPALGGLLMITAIAVDPFIQQVVRYEGCPQPLSDVSATVARTNNYTISGIHTGAMMESLDAPMQAAVYKGVYNAWSHVAPTCTTGNCTFPDFRAIGMCGRCDNVTDEILYTPVDSNTSTPAWSLASGLWIQSPYVLNMSSEAPLTMSGVVTTEIIAVTNDSLTGTFRESMYSSSSLNKTVVKPKPWTPSGPNFVTAARCSLNPCIRTISVQVNSGVLHESTLSTSPMKQELWEGGIPSPSWTASPMPCLINGNYFNATSFTESNVTNATNKWPVQGLLPNNQTAWLPDECYFSYATTLGLGQFLGSFLNGILVIAPETHYGNPAFIEQLWTGDVTYQEGATVGSNFELMNKTWDSLAESMSAHIREAGDSINSAPALGETLHMETCLVVRWRWLSYPIVLLFLTLVLVSVTSYSSFGRSTTHQLWRDSPLALLFHGLDDRSKVRAKGVEQKREMEEIAKGVYARLVDDGEGPEFQCMDRR